MSSTDPENNQHVEELLSAYALDALDEEEVALVEAHLETCPECSQARAELQEVVALLGQTVGQETPPEALQSRVVAALDREERPAKPARSNGVPRSREFRPAALVLPLAAVLVVALFGVSMGLNLRLSDRMEKLERENSTLTSRLVEFVADDAYLQDELNQLRVTNYIAASPDSRVMLLAALREASNSQGMLIVSGDGRFAMLMVAEMKQLPPSSVYQVWFNQNKKLIAVGQVRVDSNGWGTVYLSIPESVFQSDWVGLTQESEDDGDTPTGVWELGGKITPQ